MPHQIILEGESLADFDKVISYLIENEENHFNETRDDDSPGEHIYEPAARLQHLLICPK